MFQQYEQHILELMVSRHFNSKACTEPLQMDLTRKTKQKSNKLLPSQKQKSPPFFLTSIVCFLLFKFFPYVSLFSLVFPYRQDFNFLYLC